MIKNILNTFIIYFLFITPFWVGRILLISQNLELKVIDNIFNYLCIASRFDAKAAVLWFSPLIFLSGINLYFKNNLLKNCNVALFVLLIVSSFVFNLINVFYFPISKNISGIELLNLVEGQDGGIILGYIVEYWYAILGLLIIAFLLAKVFYGLKVTGTKSVVIVYTIIVFSISGLLARGSLSLKPLNLLDAYSALKSEEVKSAVTPTYVLIESIGKKQLENVNYFTDEEINRWTKTNYKAYLDLDLNKPNICLILLESFGKEYTKLNSSKEISYTPFLDSLMDESINYTNANGLRSMDAVASIFTGVPTMMDQSFIGSLYGNNTMVSAIDILKNQEYQTSFYHGADEQSMGFKAFLKAKGLDKYLGKQQYPNKEDFDGTWGIYDLPYFQYFANQLNEQIEPWFAGVFTLSSHHPYAVPEKYSSLSKGTSVIHQSVGYTDLSLRNFFNIAKRQSWFDNTVFIITADHTSINKLKQYQTHRGRYEIPLLIYSNKLTKKVVSKPVQHVDLLPTIANLSGYQDTLFCLGNSLLDSSYSSIIHYEGSRYSLTNKEYSLELVGDNKTRLYNYKKDPVYKTNLSRDSLELKNQMMDELKASIQDFNRRILTNTFN